MSISDYEIIQQLGSGTYSTVYKVLEKSSKAFFAMKEIKFDCLSTKEKEYTKTEVKILKQLTHPNIIKFEKSFSSGTNFYIIMELATGGDLQNKITSLSNSCQNFPTDTIWWYTYQLAKGLQVLHDNNILHRDIKASNIFLMENDTLKIGDFNVGKECIETLMCTKIGTPVMMSPELWNGEACNYKSDIWSLGCLVYQMVALKPPFTAENYAALYMKISRMKYKKVGCKALSGLIEKMIRKNPRSRPACAEILKMEEFKRFREAENAEKSNIGVNGLRKVKSVSSNLIGGISRDSVSYRKKVKADFSPAPNKSFYTREKLKSKEMSSAYNKNCFPQLSPQPHKSSYPRQTLNSSKAPKDSSTILSSLDFPINSLKPALSLMKIISPKPSMPSAHLKKDSENTEFLQKLHNKSERSIKFLAKLDSKLIKGPNAPRFKKTALAYLEESLVPTSKDLSRKRSLASINISPKPLSKISSAKKISQKY